MLTHIFTTKLFYFLVFLNIVKLQSIDRNHIYILSYLIFIQGYIAAKNGGIIKEIDGRNLTDIIMKLTQKFQQREIDGILFDKYTLWYAQIALNYVYNRSTAGERKVISFFTDETVRIEQKYNGPKMMYSILVKSLRDFDYFNYAVNDNSYSIQKIDLELWVSHIESQRFTLTAKSFYHSTALLFSPQHQYFILSVSTLGGCILLLCFIGYAYRLVQRIKL